MKRKFILFIITLCIPCLVAAKDITSECDITINTARQKELKDEDYNTYITKSSNSSVKVSCPEKIKNIYIVYHDKAVKGRILFENSENLVGQKGYLHELVKVNNNVNSFKLSYEEKYSLADIYLFTDDELPDYVQDWSTLETADLMLFSTHADDEQLFFAGLLPKYVDARKDVQVVYFTNHFDNKMRYHELLNGLWAVGIKNYPLISTFPDAYSKTRDGAIMNLTEAGFKIEDLLKFQVDAIRKYKPYVVVGHDENGEYGHGQHILNTYILETAYKKAMDKTFDEESVKNYGTWEIQKLYLHLYPENTLCLDYDVPLKSFDGKTAYEVSKIGYSKHISQQGTSFTEWLNGKNNQFTSVKEIKTYNPCEFGLYYSGVGDDVVKDDLFENVKDVKNQPIKDEDKKDEDINIDKNTEIKTTNDGILYVAIGIVVIVIIILLISIFLKR